MLCRSLFVFVRPVLGTPYPALNPAAALAAARLVRILYAPLALLSARLRCCVEGWGRPRYDAAAAHPTRAAHVPLLLPQSAESMGVAAPKRLKRKQKKGVRIRKHMVVRVST